MRNITRGNPLPRLAWLALLLWTAASLASGDIIKSPHDPRSYGTLELANGLKVVLVSDPGADKAAASLDVNVGSGSDPRGREGLAHFLEHMLFLGTEKYPDSAEYKDFIATHGGSDNAYTSYDHTNYFFDVDKDFLEPALDRFAQFFIAPTFTPKYVSRERQIVHSEYMSKIKNDGRRLFYIKKKVMNPKHPHSRFSVGTNETLADRDGSTIRDELLKFHEEHYSANIMALAVFGKEPLPVLEGWVREKFSAIPQTDKRPLETDEPLFGPDRLPARVNAIPVKDRRSLSLTFPIPAVEEHLRSKPTFYLSHLIGYEGKGSLLSLLKEKGWSDGLSAGLGLRHPSNATFNISVKLTPAGLEHKDQVIAYVFRYIALMRERPVPRWAFEEQRKLAELRFLYAEKEEPISLTRGLANDLHELPPRELLRGHFVLDEFDPDLIHSYLGYLRPENVLVTVVAKGLEVDARTDWYGAEYAVSPIEEQTLAAWASAGTDVTLTLPGPNGFIPDNLVLKDSSGSGNVPVALERRPGFELWHRFDTEFGLPLANMYFSVRSPVANDTAEHAVLTALYVLLVNDQLTEFSYDADLAGLGYSLYKHIRGFTVRVSGYDDKQKLLLERIVAALRNPDIHADRFAIEREDMIRRLRNSKKDSPFRRAVSEVRHLLIDPNWSEDQLLEAIANVDEDDLRRFVPKLLSRVHVVALAHGNVARGDALELAQVLEQAFIESATPVDVPGGRVVKLDKGDRYARDVDNTQPDSAIAIYFQGPDKRFESRARNALLADIMSPPFFENLRTEKELGYIVFASSMTLLEMPGIVFIVQSPIADPPGLRQHVEAFLVDFAPTIDNMDQATFERHRAALLTNLLEADTQLDDRTARYWNEIDREYYEFDLREKLATAVRATTLEELRASYRELLVGADRKRLVIRAIGQRHNVAASEQGPSGKDTVIRHAPSFRQEKGFISG
jgi:secreted Zn-dependent insulinase-like peptidase